MRGHQGYVFIGNTVVVEGRQMQARRVSPSVSTTHTGHPALVLFKGHERFSLATGRLKSLINKALAEAEKVIRAHWPAP